MRSFYVILYFVVANLFVLGIAITGDDIFIVRVITKYSIKKDNGEFLIEALGRMKISMDKYKTSEMGRALKKVYKGAISVSDSVSLAEKEIRDIFDAYRASLPPEEDTNTGCVGDVVGKCPLCAGEIRRTTFGYGCSEYKTKACRFSVKEYICGRAISLSNMKLLLETGKTSVIKGFVSSKSGKRFDAALKLDGSDVKFEFDSSAPKKVGHRSFDNLYSASRRYEANPELPPDFFDS